ncbi:MAG: VTT domain-containing protein [bacterium]
MAGPDSADHPDAPAAGGGPGDRPKGAVVSAVLTGLLVAAAITLLLLYGRQLWHLFRRPAELRALVAGWGAWAPLGIIGFQVLQILLAPLPGHPLSFAVGYAYGFWPGIAWLMVGIMLGATINFLLARILGRRLLRFFVSADRLAQLDRMVIRRGAFYVFLLILIPNPVGDLAYYIAGLTALPLPLFLTVVFLARLPTSLLECGLGSGATRFGWLEWLLLGAAALVAVLLYLRFRRRVTQLLERWSGVGREPH